MQAGASGGRSNRRRRRPRRRAHAGGCEWGGRRGRVGWAQAMWCGGASREGGEPPRAVAAKHRALPQRDTSVGRGVGRGRQSHAPRRGATAGDNGAAARWGHRRPTATGLHGNRARAVCTATGHEGAATGHEGAATGYEDAATGQERCARNRAARAAGSRYGRGTFSTMVVE